ncbi:MAG: glutathione S-transferase [Oceanicoccus sp.]|jgi:glutathione S-transferase
MHMIAVTIGLILVEYYVFIMMVGAARGKSGIAAPAMTGDPRLERMLRVQLNTLEQIVVVIPALWLFGQYMSELYGAILGLAFIIGRAMYCWGYLADPKSRGAGFMVGMLATIALLLGGLAGAVMAFF